MRTKLKKTLFAILPLAGLLFMTTPAAAGHDDWEHKRSHNALGRGHHDYHHDRNAWHQEFHRFSHTKGEHRRFHRALKQDHRGFHRGRQNLHYDYHNRGWYGGRRYYDDYYGYRSRYPRPFYYNQPWWNIFLYR